MKNILFLLICFVFVACQPKTENTGDIEKYKKEILQTEKDFEKMAAEKGIREAFLYYSADNVVLNRFNLLYKGTKQVNIYFDYVKLEGSKLNWTPDYVDVSSSGDMAYTYGKFTFAKADSTGKMIERKGFFHSIWKRQSDGKWKLVWD